MKLIVVACSLLLVLSFLQARPCERKRKASHREHNSLVQKDEARIAKNSNDPTVDTLEKGDPTLEAYQKIKLQKKLKHEKAKAARKKKAKKAKEKKAAKAAKKKQHQVERKMREKEKQLEKAEQLERASHVVENKANDQKPPQNGNQNPPPPNQLQNQQPSFGFPFFRPIPIYYVPQGQPMPPQLPSPPGVPYQPMPGVPSPPGVPYQPMPMWNMRQLENTYMQFGNTLQGLWNAQQNQNLNNAQHVTYVVPYVRKLENLYNTIYDQWKGVTSPYPKLPAQYGIRNQYILSDLNSIYPLSDPLNLFRFVPQLSDLNSKYADLLNALYRLPLDRDREWWRAYQHGQLDERINSAKPTEHIVVHHRPKPVDEVRYVVNHHNTNIVPEETNKVHLVIDDEPPPPSDNVQYIIHGYNHQPHKSVQVHTTENGNVGRMLNEKASNTWTDNRLSFS